MAKSTIKLWLRTDKILNDGTAPIFIIYQISGQRKYVNTGIKILPENWDNKNQVVIFLNKKTVKELLLDTDVELLLLASEVDDINNKLNRVVNDIKNIEKRFELDKTTYTPELVIAEYHNSKDTTAKKDQSRTIVLEYIDRYMDEQKSTKAKASLTVYKSLKKHLSDFNKYRGGRITFSDMDKSFFANFQTYLLEVKDLRNTTIAKQLSTLKSILLYAESCGIEVNPNYRNFKIRREKLPVIALTQQEFQKLFYLDLSKKDTKVEGFKIIKGKPEIVSYSSLIKARDLFCFACVTGLRYSDLVALRRENIKNDTLNITVVKTKEQLQVPLSEYATIILEKYKNSVYPLPRLSNQKLNDYLKVVASIAGITDIISVPRYKGAQRTMEQYPKHKLLGAHTGRKTFCTISLERGMSAEQVMAISGHRDYKSFQRYVDISDENKKQALLNAWSMQK